MKDLINLSFCPEFFVHVGKRLDKKVRLISNFMTSQEWTTNSYNTHIAQYLKKKR